MLNTLFIRHFVLIDEIEIDFRSGMTVLTGETGAGKSIILDALGIAFGERVDSRVIRNGCSEAHIVVSIDTTSLPHVTTWLTEQALIEASLSEQHDCIIRRIISREGRSKAYINGHLVPLAQLRELGDYLIDIHGQHAHHSLLKTDTHRVLLDEFGDHQALCDTVKSLYQHWRETQKKLVAATTTCEERTQRIAFLRYQLAEFDALIPKENEWELLTSEHNSLAHREELLSHCQQALLALSDGEKTNALSLLHQSVKGLEKLQQLYTSASSALELIHNAIIQVEEASNEVRRYSDTAQEDPERLHFLETRMGAFHDLARKHRILPEQLLDFQQRLQAELDELVRLDVGGDELQILLAEQEQQYLEQAQILSEKRQQAAQHLSQLIMQQMHHLGMPGGVLAIQCDASSENKTPHGIDQVVIMVSANPGQPLNPLHKVASGGELSRINLAIEVSQRQKASKPIIVFDEVDVGIGGATAEIVGELLHTLGEKAQVLCVTHLPQVAAKADHHIHMHKITQKGDTYTRVSTLSQVERVQEVARMLGGVAITDKTLKHAEEMLGC